MPYIPILLTVCNNISMKDVVEFVKSVKLLKMLVDKSFVQMLLNVP